PTVLPAFKRVLEIPTCSLSLTAWLSTMRPAPQIAWRRHADPVNPALSGGDVIERAAILAAGADSPAVIAWIISHAGEPESAVVSASANGLHGARLGGTRDAPSRPPLRFVLPAGTL